VSSPYLDKGSLVIDNVKTMSEARLEIKNKGSLLARVNSPADLRKMNILELEVLAEEVRKFIIDIVSANGGHLASSLGAVELTIALHYVFNTPADKVIWDVGHQVYAHKILTGRKKAFSTMRTYGGISGFPKCDESEYDAFGTGHSSTSISAALGIAQANHLKGLKNKAIAVIGDGSLMSGIAFEGLNHAGHLKEDLIVILNDNGMSISKNVGALAASLSSLISGQAFNRFRMQMKTAVEKIPGIGNSVRDILRKSEGFVKSLFMPGLIFHELGFLYIGPVDGHRLDVMINRLHNLSTIPGPILFHVVTKKGKGYKPAEEDPILYHGVSPFDKVSGIDVSVQKTPSYTDTFGEALLKVAEEDKRIIAITAGMTHGTGLEQFEKRFPDRFYDVGIAEQHAVTFAAGLATEGFRPVVAIYSTFLQRAYDQIIHDVCLQDLPVVFMLDRGGLVGEDGQTHHGSFDISYLRSMPNLIFMAPKDGHELQQMLFTALQLPHPVAIRYPRGSAPNCQLPAAVPDFLQIGKAEILTEGKDVAIFAIGATVYPALEAAEQLAREGIQCSVINSRFIKPLDKNLILSIAKSHPLILTVEENVLQGGFGSALREVLFNHEENASAGGPYPQIFSLGIPDEFVTHGSQKQLRKYYYLDSEGIYNTIKILLCK